MIVWPIRPAAPTTATRKALFIAGARIHRVFFGAAPDSPSSFRTTASGLLATSTRARPALLSASRNIVEDHAQIGRFRNCLEMAKQSFLARLVIIRRDN